MEQSYPYGTDFPPAGNRGNRGDDTTATQFSGTRYPWTDSQEYAANSHRVTHPEYELNSWSPHPSPYDNNGTSPAGDSSAHLGAPSPDATGNAMISYHYQGGHSIASGYNAWQMESQRQTGLVLQRYDPGGPFEYPPLNTGLAGAGQGPHRPHMPTEVEHSHWPSSSFTQRRSFPNEASLHRTRPTTGGFPSPPRDNDFAIAGTAGILYPPVGLHTPHESSHGMPHDNTLPGQVVPDECEEDTIIQPIGSKDQDIQIANPRDTWARDGSKQVSQDVSELTTGLDVIQFVSGNQMQPGPKRRGGRTGPLKEDQRNHAKRMRKAGACKHCRKAKIAVRSFTPNSNARLSGWTQCHHKSFENLAVAEQSPRLELEETQHSSHGRIRQPIQSRSHTGETISLNASSKDSLSVQVSPRLLYALRMGSPPGMTDTTTRKTSSGPYSPALGPYGMKIPSAHLDEGIGHTDLGNQLSNNPLFYTSKPCLRQYSALQIVD